LADKLIGTSFIGFDATRIGAENQAILTGNRKRYRLFEIATLPGLDALPPLFLLIDLVN
jgi:hypothetical protein